MRGPLLPARLQHHLHLALNVLRRHNPRQRPHRAASACLQASKAVLLSWSQLWIWLYLQARRIPLLIPHGTRSSPGNSSATSTVISSGRPATAKSSSSVTPTMRTRRTRTPPSTPRLLHLLLQTPRTLPPLHPMSTKHPMGCQMIMLTVGMKPVHLRSSM
jgi:hypothetical protein